MEKFVKLCHYPHSSANVCQTNKKTEIRKLSYVNTRRPLRSACCVRAASSSISKQESNFNVHFTLTAIGIDAIAYGRYSQEKSE